MAITYGAVKQEALEILDDATVADLVKDYGTEYTVKTLLFKGLGIPPERMAVMAHTVNEALVKYPNSMDVTAAGLVNCRTVGDYISLYCRAVPVDVPKGEPK
jgi:hypothetical protein